MEDQGASLLDSLVEEICGKQTTYIEVDPHNQVQNKEESKSAGLDVVWTLGSFPASRSRYESVPGDDIDAAVQYLAKRLGSDDIRIWRVNRGLYEIDGERVNMEWARVPSAGCRVQRQVMVTRVTGGLAEPLQTFLEMASSVKKVLSSSVTPVLQMPLQARMSFDDRGVRLRDADGGEGREAAMRLAAQQARVRAEHAQSWMADQRLAQRVCQLRVF